MALGGAIFTSATVEPGLLIAKRRNGQEDLAVSVHISETLFLLGLSLVFGCGDRITETRCSGSGSYERHPLPLTTNLAKVIIGDTSTREPHFMTNASGDVIKFPDRFGGFIFYEQDPIEPYVVISEGSELRLLLDDLCPIPQSSEQGLSFSGVLSEQFYLDAEDQLVMYSFIICDDCTVVVGTNEGSVVRIGEEYRFVPATNRVNVHSVAIRRPEYVRRIYSLMQNHAPQQIRKRRESYKEIGIDFEPLLFDGKLQPIPNEQQ